MSTRCRARMPQKCRHHGGRVINGFPSPRDWIGRKNTITKRAREGKKSNTRQIHGFHNEYHLCKKYDLLKMDHYTSRWDAYTKTPNPIPVSIKTMQIGSEVPLADFFRNKEIKEDFYLIVAMWEGQKHNIVKETTLFIPKGFWNAQFNDLCDEKIREAIQNSSPEHSYDEKWRMDCQSIRDDWVKSQSIIRLRPKRDHKKTVRMQCAISFNDFINISKMYEVNHIPYGNKAKLNMKRKVF